MLLFDDSVSMCLDVHWFCLSLSFLSAVVSVSHSNSNGVRRGHSDSYISGVDVDCIVVSLYIMNSSDGVQKTETAIIILGEFSSLKIKTAHCHREVMRFAHRGVDSIFCQYTVLSRQTRSI